MNKIKYNFKSRDHVSDFEIRLQYIKTVVALNRWKNKLNEIEEDIDKIKQNHG